jgi:hypothetical protein
MVGHTRKVVKVFLASPSDLQDERSLAKATVDEFNDTIGKSLGYHVDLVGWEDTIAGYGQPQSLINKDLEQCEYFIGLMWQRWGSPPDSGAGEFSSGFEEEFELTLRRRGRETKPEISLFFKNIAPEFLRDPGPGLTRVLAFRQKMEAEKRVMFETFGDEREYSRKLRRCIFSYVQGLATQDAEQKSEQQQERPTSNADAPAQQVQGVARDQETGVRTSFRNWKKESRQVEQMKKLGEYIRKGMTRKSLDILCKKMNVEDVGLIRRVLEREFVDYSASDVAYFVRYGNWDDIPLLISMTKRPVYRGASLMLFSSDDMYLIVAKAILRLGLGRLAELLAVEMSSGLKALLIANAPHTSFAKLSIEVICKLLRSEDIGLRKSMCLKCLAVFKQARLKKILDAYVAASEIHYYNVIHWFDFGISIPPQIVAPAVKRAMRST